MIAVARRRAWLDYLERCCFFTTARQDEQINGPLGLPAFPAGTGPDRF
jgi:hypothetical protein